MDWEYLLFVVPCALAGDRNCDSVCNFFSTTTQPIGASRPLGRAFCGFVLRDRESYSPIDVAGEAASRDFRTWRVLDSSFVRRNLLALESPLAPPRGYAKRSTWTWRMKRGAEARSFEIEGESLNIALL